MPKQLHDKQIQGSDGTFRTTISLDEATKRHFDLLIKYAYEVLGMKLSHSVIIRAGITELFLSTIEQIHNAHAGTETKAEILNRLMDSHNLNRQKFLRAAGKETTLPDPIEALME